jgi:hypothetical protein
MLQEPKTSPFAYGLAAVLAVVGWFLLRPAPKPAPPAPPPAAVPPTPPGTAFTEANDQEILEILAAALARAGQPPMRSPRDVLASLLATRPPPIPAGANRTTFDAAIQRRRDGIEGILAGTSAYLDPGQLAVFRTVLERDLATLAAQRARARP